MKGTVSGNVVGKVKVIICLMLALLFFILPGASMVAHATEDKPETTGETPAEGETPSEGEAPAEGEAVEGEAAEGEAAEGEVVGEGDAVAAFEIQNVVFIGDDTAVGMRSNAGENTNVWICETGKGLTWAKEAIDKQVSSFREGYAYVFCLGLNEVANTSEADKYVEYFNELVEKTAEINCKFYYMSVNPIDEEKYGNKLNAKIYEWNNRIKNALPESVSYIDTCTSISASYVTTNDGIHYTEQSYKTLYDMVLKVLGLQTPEEIAEAGRIQPVEIKAVNGWGTDTNGIRVYYDSNEQIVTGWKTVDGGDYYFDENGYYVTGLQTIDGHVRFFSPIGIMKKGSWCLVDADNHYMLFDENGYQMLGWQDYNANRYYIGKDGWRLTGWWTIGTRVYYFEEDGRVAQGLTFIGDNVYFFNDDGSVRVGWYEADDGKRYYFGEGGKMVFGKNTIDGKAYYFRETGEQIIGWNNEADGTRYYLPDGTMATGWQTIDNNRYYFDDGGLMMIGWASSGEGKRYFGKSGAMASGLTVINGKYYFFNANGIMQIGWLINSDGKRYFDPDGAMLLGWQQIDGEEYYFNEDGTAQVDNAIVGGKICTFNADGELGFSVSVTLLKVLAVLLVLGVFGFIAYRKRESLTDHLREFVDVVTTKTDRPSAAKE